MPSTDDATHIENATETLRAISASQAMIEFDMNGGILTANDNFLNALGYMLSEIEGKNHSMFLEAQASGSAAYRQFWDDLRNGKFQAGEFKRIHKNGDAVWIQATYNPVLGADGKPFKVVKTALDITEQKLATLKTEAEAYQVTQMVEQMPINVMICDLENFAINYMNKSTRETLKTLEHLLPKPVDQLMGESIDIFHKDPSHQRRLLSNPNNLPFNTLINVGDEILDLNVTAILNNDGDYIAPMLTWSIVTEKVKADEDTARMIQMMDNMPINVLMCGKDDLKINYINQTSIKTLRPLEHLLPAAADQLMGVCIDIFHTNPSMQRRLLADPNNLPHRASIKLGDETLDLNVSAVTNRAGEYLGPMLSWSVITDQLAIAQNVQSVAEFVATAAGQLDASARVMSDAADRVSQQSGAVAAASEEASTNVQTVASAAEQLSSSITEISRQVVNSTEIAQAASDEAERTNVTVESLAAAGQKIGKVVDLINNIAGQTNLLALNATIEAARAGDAGKGFAVVASEVKSLANQTARATEDISAQINNIQTVTRETVTAIDSIRNTIGQINEITSGIASAVEEQGAATQEISRNIVQASEGTQEVTTNISDVTEAASEAGAAAGEVLQSASELTAKSGELRTEIEGFLKRLQA